MKTQRLTSFAFAAAILVLACGVANAQTKIHIGKAQPKESVQQSFAELLSAVNAKLPTHERVSKLVLTNDAWTIENGLLTPTLKLKRQPMEQRYGALLERIAEQPGAVVWQ